MSERRREVMWERKDEREVEQSREGERNDLSLPSVWEITPALRQPKRLMHQEAPGKRGGAGWGRTGLSCSVLPTTQNIINK